MKKYNTTQKTPKKTILLADEHNNPLLIKYSNYIPTSFSDSLYLHLLNRDNWMAQIFRIGSKWVNLPRETIAYSRTGEKYSYSRITINPDKYDKKIELLQKKIKEVCNQECDYYLCNKYDNIDNYIG